MTLGTLCLCLTCLWLVIHALNYFILTCHRPSVLPTFTTPRNRNTTQITLKHIHLRIQTTAWNSAHERLTSRLARKRYDAVRKGMCLFYNLGSGAGVVGMVLVICILGWTLGGLAVRLVRRFAVREDGVNGIVKRALEDTHVVQTVRTTSFIKPIIPGVTVPLTQLPVIFFSVFICQIIHEAGHALPAALEQIPLSTVGLSLTFILPSAFVTFPNATLTPPSSSPIQSSKDKLKQRAMARMRLVAGGAWHNLVFWGVLVLFGSSSVAGLGKGWIWGLVGYEDVSLLGRVVVGLDEDSPLHEHLPLGALITRLDDVRLGTSSSPGLPRDEDIWTSYLTGKYRPTEEQDTEGAMGWCVDRIWWIDQPTMCCDHPPISDTGSLSSPRLSCFLSLSRPEHDGGRCLDPIPILTNSHSSPSVLDDSSDGSRTRTPMRRRCSLSHLCLADNECVKLHEDEPILRIAFQVQPSDNVDVLWSGPKVEVWEQVEIDTVRPRFRFLPLGLPRTLQISFEYLQMATLSLYLFNLLPLPFLDGTQLLDAVFNIVIDTSSPMEVDLQTLEGGRGRSARPRRWKHWVGTGIKSGTVGLFACCVGFGVIDWVIGR